MRRFGESPPRAGGQTPEFECRRRLRPKLGVRPPRGGGGSPWFVFASQSDRRRPRAQPARSPARVGASGGSGDRAAVSGTHAHRSHRTDTRGNWCRSLAAVRRSERWTIGSPFEGGVDLSCDESAGSLANPTYSRVMDPPVHFRRRLAMLAATGLAVAATGCGATSSTSTSTSTASADLHVLKGCYALPFSGGKVDLRPVEFYAVTTTPDTICFRVLSAGSKCSAAPGYAASYGNPIVDTDEPRSGGYSVTYYPWAHRWFLVPECP